MRIAMLGACAASAGLTMLAGGAAAMTPEARKFGLRDDVQDISLSPDGRMLAVLKPNGARGGVVMVFPADGSSPPRPVLATDGDPRRITGCSWGSATRLVCTIFTIEAVGGGAVRPATRLFALDADGGNMKMLSARNSSSLGVALSGGSIVDWTGGREGSVLMTRVYVPTETTGTFTAVNLSGVGVDRVDLTTLARTMVEAPNEAAADYISDGHGTVRVMAVRHTNTRGQATGDLEYRYRRKGSRDWLPLVSVHSSNYRTTGFAPQAVDDALDVVYGLETVDGRVGVYSLALDGSMKKTLVFQAPAASGGVDDLIEIGRQHRVVGASWITDKRDAEMFDPELKRFTAALSKTLPRAPNVSIVDASADETKLVVFAGSDDDPGRFYLFDKPTKHLTEIMPVRPVLADVPLGAMRAITYPAADGTRIPAYLTLPRGGTGKGLPAIVLPHGGPSYRDQWSFDWLPQFFAARGYAVIQPQYRGSTGYGDAFFGSNAIRGWRQAIDDVDDAGRWLVKEGIADPAHLAIVGWSYGGYAALQSQVVAPDLFKAVVAIAPVTDFAQMRRDMLQEGRTTQTQTDALFGDARNLTEGSPAAHADRFAAPVLMYMGNLDQNVPVAQGRLMEARLKAAGKQVRYVEVKGLDHQLDDSAVRQDMLDDADQFLRGAMKM